jgi:hypothetical protein
VYKHTDGREQEDDPSKPEGIIAIANAIPNMRALSSLNLAENAIGGYFDCCYGMVVATPEGTPYGSYI